MKQPKARPKVYLAFPGYSPEANMEAMHAVEKDVTRGQHFDIRGRTSQKSLLANNFNRHYVRALNDPTCTHYAQLHTDLAPQAFWLDILWKEKIAARADYIAAVVPLKGDTGTTSTAIGIPDSFWYRRRLTLKEIWRLPETFSIEDVVAAGLAPAGTHLLANSGCILCDLLKPWNRETHPVRSGGPGPALKVFWTIADCIFQHPDGRFEAAVVPEDWMFSRMLAENGAKVVCTRKVVVKHWGWKAFDNASPWGQETDETPPDDD